MDNEADIFAKTLKKSNKQTPVALYNEEKKVTIEHLQEYSVRSALVIISKQIKAFQSADNIIKGCRNRRNLNTLKMNDFLPLTVVSKDTQLEQTSNKFETQCVSDSQLINIIENAEALIDGSKNMIQEFDNIDTCTQNMELDKIRHCKDTNNTDIQEYTNKSNIIHDNNANSVDIKYSQLSNVKELEAESTADEEMCALEDDSSIVDGGPKSPILNTSPKIPLVFKLESFENFEKIALSVIKDNPDFEAAKRLINSQIVNNELFIQSHAEPVLYDRDKSMSPVLTIQKPIKNDEEKRKKKVKDMVVEDEILFSDDEIEFNNDFEELPLTSALETSLCNLDKTMYVGFQTASDKSIQVQTNTYSKAKSILDNIKTPTECISLTELVEVIDKHSKSNNSFSCKLDKTEFEVEDCQDIDFETEFDESTNTSEIMKRNFENISKCNNNTNICQSNSLQTPVETAESNTKIDIDENFKVCAFNANEDYRVCHESDKITPLNDQFNIDEHIMKEFESNFISEDYFKDNSSDAKVISLNAEISDKLTPSNIANKARNNLPFIGFKTANNQEIKISKQGLAKTKSIFEDINLDNLEETDNNFQYNVNNDDVYAGPSTSKGFIGFKTANNKEIKISEAALAKTKNIFDNIDNEAKIVTATSVSTKESKTKEAINKINNKGDFVNPFPINKKANNDIKSVSTLIGFKTASNKPVEISKEALFKTKNIFKEIMSEEIENVPYKETDCVKDPFLMKELDTAKQVKMSNESLERSKNIFKDLDLDDDKRIVPQSNAHHKKMISNTMQGFQTASNKLVPVSNEALAKTKHIFQDIDNLYGTDDKDYITDINKFNLESDHVLGFKTASDKPVTVTKEALVKSKEMLKEFKVCEGTKTIVEDTSKLVFEGFKTASNKEVKISKDALARSKKVFQDMDIEINKSEVLKEEKQTKFFGFQTASNKPVKISEDALAKSKKIFQDSDIDEGDSKDVTTEKQNVFGFKTASNKSVQISEDALTKSRKLFQDLNKEINNQAVTEFEENKFAGFQTASRKRVGVSNEALLKSKKIFKDIDLNTNFNDCDINIDVNKDKVTFGIKTANNNKVSITEDSLKNAKKIFDDVNKVETEVKTIDDDCQFNIEDLMNTEVIKNLEESLHTEDFTKTSPTSKRSASPILSCPKAKKRKIFKIPLTVNKSHIPSNVRTAPSTNCFVFPENYKVNKKYTLKQLKEIESNNSDKNIDPYILNFKFENILDIEFRGKRNDIDSDIWTTDKIVKCFTDSVNTKIVPKGWIANHLKLILWKLLSYEVCFPICMKDVCTVTNVLNQLKYRYNRELYNVERPALRKVLEKDEVASKLMVLCVVGLYADGVGVSSVTSSNQKIELCLTDGWYCIKASTDKMIDNLICGGRICVGTKLAIYGAELVNCDQGIAPWEDTSAIRLKISANSTRRARWDTKLGFQVNGAILSHLSSVRPEGGKISRLRVFVTRVYPMLYVEKFEDGSTLTRSERLEHMQEMKHEADRQNQIEKLYDELEKMADREFQDSEELGSDKGFETGSQIYRHFMKCKDTSEFRINLTESQTHLLKEHTVKKRDKVIESLQNKIQDMVMKRGLDVSRNVVPLLKIRVADVHNNCVSRAIITIWRPNECLLDLITEGAWLDVYNVVPTAVRYSEIQISAGRQSIFEPSKLNKSNKFKAQTDTLKRKCHTISDLQSTSTDNEIDTIGFVFLIEPLTNQSQNIYLADENNNIILINFWEGIKKFGFENILDVGQVVACLNLQKRTGNTKKKIQQYRVTEFTYFTRTCKIDSIRKMTEELSNKFSSINKKEFINDCIAIKNNYNSVKHGNTENVTPYRLNNSDYNISKNKMFIDTPLVNKMDANLNLSGLDFESTFKQTDTQDMSPERLLRKRKVNERIEKLKMYGEPPALSLIHIKNKSNATKPYKSPLIPKTDSNVASANLPTNSASPVNRAYVKNINPIKLNFVNVDGNTTDPFAEEFDCSPPLSLD